MREFSRTDQLISQHLYGLQEVMHYAEELRANPAARAAALRCLELAEELVDDGDLSALRKFLEERYQRDPADYEPVYGRTVNGEEHLVCCQLRAPIEGPVHLLRHGEGIPKTW